ncbi:histidine kinase [Piscinibacter sp. XHJ-5]|uniref:histidine kinase n=1 Tax=Piscinibacter sp. XHJ-5 TaxID=3037797 RepID=UPI0024535308|nr:histidine kinase [Piscinibacter sp. XHJ-5]
MASTFDVSSASRSAAGGIASFFSAIRRAFIAYARWLDSITWMRFFLLSVLAIIVTGILSELPPFNLPWGQDRTEIRTGQGDGKRDNVSIGKDGIHIEGVKRDGKSYSISIDESGVHITPNGPAAPEAVPSVPSPPAPPASVVPPPPAPPPPGLSVTPKEGVTIELPKNATTDEIKQAIEDAQAKLEEKIAEAQNEVEEAIADAKPKVRTIRAFRLGDHMVGWMMLWIFFSIIVKIMAAGRFKAEAQAVQATEIAESEALKRQVVEARMAAMQAQVEPHFLFNTLASIDHLIETDPARASTMQKNLIALLRASMPTMREANARGTRDLGRELAVIRPYLEILKVRMEERLRTDVRVPDGLLSADFPPMMLQGLVENAIKHGLEPKAEGGTLTVSAEIVHGKLAVTVADTGLGFGKAPTAGTGIGLNNIRERLQLLYGSKASLTVAENPGGGTAVTITVPYTMHHHQGEAA